AMNLLLPAVMQLPTETRYGLGQSVVPMAIRVMPMGIGMRAVAKPGAAISAARPPRVTHINPDLHNAPGSGSDSAVLALGTNHALGSSVDTVLISLILLSTSSLIVGAGIGLAFGAIPAVIISAVPLSETAAANGFNALMRSLGTTSASAVLGVILAAMVTTFNGTEIATLSAYVIGLGVTTVLALMASLTVSLISKH